MSPARKVKLVCGQMTAVGSFRGSLACPLPVAGFSRSLPHYSTHRQLEAARAFRSLLPENQGAHNRIRAPLSWPNSYLGLPLVALVVTRGARLSRRQLIPVSPLSSEVGHKDSHQDSHRDLQHHNQHQQVWTVCHCVFTSTGSSASVV